MLCYLTCLGNFCDLFILGLPSVFGGNLGMFHDADYVSRDWCDETEDLLIEQHEGDQISIKKIDLFLENLGNFFSLGIAWSLGAISRSCFPLREGGEGHKGLYRKGCGGQGFGRNCHDAEHEPSCDPGQGDWS